MRIETCTSMGTTKYGANEDYAFASQFESCAGVLDGASGLTGRVLTGYPSDSAWFSYRLGTNLRGLLHRDDLGILEALRDAGDLTANEYKSITANESVAREDEPSAALAIVKWGCSCDEDVLEAAVLGDCLCVVDRKDGSTEILKDNLLSGFDNQAIDLLGKYIHDEGLSFKEAREKINDMLIENRLLRNREDGYWIADISCMGYPHAEIRRESLSNIQGIFLCSDGFANAVSMGVCSNLNELANEVKQGRGQEILNALRKAESSDSEIVEHPRFKKSDDATFVYVWMED